MSANPVLQALTEVAALSDAQYEALKARLEKEGLPGPAAVAEESPAELLDVMAEMFNWTEA